MNSTPDQLFKLRPPTYYIIANHTRGKGQVAAALEKGVLPLPIVPKSNNRKRGCMYRI